MLQNVLSCETEALVFKNGGISSLFLTVFRLVTLSDRFKNFWLPRNPGLNQAWAKMP